MALMGVVIPMACSNTSSEFVKTMPSTPVVVSATATNAFGFTSTPTFTMQPTGTITNTPTVVTAMTGPVTLCTPNVPNGLAVNSAGTTIYVAGGDGNLSIYPITGGSAITMINQFSTTGASFTSLSGVAIDSNGNLYVLDSGGSLTSPGTVYEFGSTSGPGGPVTAITTLNNYNGVTFISPQGIAVDSNNNLYVVDTGNDVIDEFGPAPSNAVSQLMGYPGGGGDGGLNNPTGIATNGSLSAVTVFVADMGDELIQEFNPRSGAPTTQFSTLPESFDPGVLGIAVDGTGDVFAADYNNGFVQDFNSTSSPGALNAQWAPTSPPPVFGPTGVAYSGTKLYITDYDNNAVYAVTP